MARGTVEVVKANKTIIILKARLRSDFRFTIPKNVRGNWKPDEMIKVTIEKEEVVDG